jgi:hypothetical protein
MSEQLIHTKVEPRHAASQLSLFLPQILQLLAALDRDTSRALLIPAAT